MDYPRSVLVLCFLGSIMIQTSFQLYVFPSAENIQELRQSESSGSGHWEEDRRRHLSSSSSEPILWKKKRKSWCVIILWHIPPFFPFESYIIQYSKSSQVPLHQSRKFRDRSSHLQSLGFSISPSSFLVHLFFHLFFCFRYFVCPVLIFLIILNSILIYEVDDIDDVDGGGAIGHTGIGFASESRIQGGLMASS